MTRPTLILGAGLAGLTAARDLHARGVDVLVLEAQADVGGRIRATQSGGGVFDLGPTWIHDQHTELLALMEDLGVERFEQFMEAGGRVDLGMRGVFDLDHPAPVESTWRVIGGTIALIESLRATLPDDVVRTGSHVDRLTLAGDHVHVRTADGTSIAAERVITTITPRVFLHAITVEPALDDDVRAGLVATPIWMGHVVKFWARYDTPFWRASGGYGFAQTGIVAEVHDHTDATGSVFALTGFLHPGAHRIDPEERRARCLAQLARLFGPEADSPRAYGDLSWPDEPTASFPDADPVVPGTRFGDARLRRPALDGRLFFSGTECEPEYGGYMEGAVRSARRAVAWAIAEGTGRR